MSGTKSSKTSESSQIPSGITLAGEDYIVVRRKNDEKDAGDVKAVVPTIDVALGGVRPSVMKLFSSSLSKGKTFRTRLVYDAGLVTGTAATALKTVINNDLTLATDWTSFALLFEEARCHSVTLISLPGTTASGAGVIDANSVCGVIAYDPSDVGALTSIAGAMSHIVHDGPFQMGNSTGLSVATGQFVPSQLSMTTKGHRKLGPVKLIPQLPTNSGGVVSPSTVGSNWMPTTAAAIVTSYFKYMLETPTASTAWNHRSMVLFDVEFRMRG